MLIALEYFKFLFLCSRLSLLLSLSPLSLAISSIYTHKWGKHREHCRHKENECCHHKWRCLHPTRFIVFHQWVYSRPVDGNRLVPFIWVCRSSTLNLLLADRCRTCLPHICFMITIFTSLCIRICASICVYISLTVYSFVREGIEA